VKRRDRGLAADRGTLTGKPRDDNAARCRARRDSAIQGNP
jgi:hypothetical protein